MSSRMLAGRVLVVTGGADGIGRAVAIAGAEHGARAVVVGDLRPPTEPYAEATAGIDHQSVFHFVRTDVSIKTDVDRLLAAADEHGGVDVMVCNAGIALPDDGPDLPEEKYRKLLSVNLDGVFFSAQAAARQMRAKSKPGSIVLMASMGGLRGSAATVVYSATKGAVILLAKSLADALGPHGIRVNAVCPGVIETSLVRSSPAVEAMLPLMAARTPLRRIGKPREVAEAVAWLGSDYSSFVSGAALVVDGGLSAVL